MSVPNLGVIFANLCGRTGTASPDALDPGLPPIGDQRVLRDEWHVRDHLGSTRVVYNLSAASGTTVASRILEKDDYLPFGQRRFGPTTGSNRWRFSGKEEMSVSLTELGILDFGARYYDPASARWLFPDPLREKYYGINPYTYCAGDPVNYVDPDGNREWPIHSTYKQYTHRKHENNYGTDRGGRTHQGVDINYLGAGNNDKGAPVLATHSGRIVRLVNYSEDKNAGGTRIKIESTNGRVSSYYMHLDSITDGLELGDYVSEGQQIGTLGQSGKGMVDAYMAHLHYELFINGQNIDPTIGIMRP